jgi:hypothetical protein
VGTCLYHTPEYGNVQLLKCYVKKKRKKKRKKTCVAG